MKQKLFFLSSLLTIGGLTTQTATAQSLGNTLGAGETALVFFEDFGTPAGREKAQYAPVGHDAFIYGDSLFHYPLPRPAHEAWASNDAWNNAAKLVENNHYVVVAPRNIYYSVPSFRALNPTMVPGGAPGNLNNMWLTWETLPGRNDAPTTTNPTGTANGGVMLVNAGVTPGVLYDRDVPLERGKFYKLTFSFMRWNDPVALKVNFYDATKSIKLASTGTVTTNITGDKVWDEQTVYFSLPNNPSCNASATYHINLQNNVMATGGNDFAVDNIRLVEVSSVPQSIIPHTVAAPCATPPVPTKDSAHSNNITSPYTLNFIGNDKLSDGITVPVLGTNASFNFVVPTGEGLDPYNLNVLYIRGEGSWTVDPNQGTITFTPEAGFYGNPLPIEYTITETSTGITSVPATIQVTYELPIAPFAADDEQLTPNQGNAFNVPIFGNDEDDILNPLTQVPPNSRVVQINHPLNEGVLYKTSDPNGIPTIDIPGEGTWEYDPTTASFTFTPLSSFTGTPTLLEYRFQVPNTPNPVWSNWAGVTLGPIGSPLPVKLATFQAVLHNNVVVLDWTTVSEVNNIGFDVERSSNGADWKTIGFVATKSTNGLSKSKLAYTFTDNNPAVNKNLYRLKQTDVDGKIDYSTIKTIWINDHATMSAYPNPTNDAITIAGLAHQEVIYLSDIAGKGLMQWKVTEEKMTVSLAQLKPGTYLITIVNAAGNRNTLHIVKSN